jgi:hypothetical protein
MAAAQALLGQGEETAWRLRAELMAHYLTLRILSRFTSQTFPWQRNF